MKRDPASRAAADEAMGGLIILAMEDELLKGRLVLAWVERLSKINPDELSPPFRKKFLKIQTTVSKHGLARNSVDALTPKEANDLVGQMVHFALDIYSFMLPQTK